MDSPKKAKKPRVDNSWYAKIIEAQKTAPALSGIVTPLALLSEADDIKDVDTPSR